MATASQSNDTNVPAEPLPELQSADAFRFADLYLQVSPSSADGRGIALDGRVRVVAIGRGHCFQGPEAHFRE